MRRERTVEGKTNLTKWTTNWDKEARFGSSFTFARYASTYIQYPLVSRMDYWRLCKIKAGFKVELGQSMYLSALGADRYLLIAMRIIKIWRATSTL
jgi:hypothetical protein